MFKTTNLQIPKLYTFYFFKQLYNYINFSFFEPLITIFINLFNIGEAFTRLMKSFCIPIQKRESIEKKFLKINISWRNFIILKLKVIWGLFIDKSWLNFFLISCWIFLFRLFYWFLLIKEWIKFCIYFLRFLTINKSNHFSKYFCSLPPGTVIFQAINKF